jgi:hypothetical protein
MKKNHHKTNINLLKNKIKQKNTLKPCKIASFRQSSKSLGITGLESIFKFNEFFNFFRLKFFEIYFIV